MKIEEDKSLRNYNTFGIDVSARYFVSVASIPDLQEALAHRPCDEIFILGGGSNMLLTKDIEAFVIHIGIKGIEVIGQDENVRIKVGGGEVWHDFVLFAIAHDFGGVENLSLIPGNVGTGPVQNIGAYGVELESVFESCTAVHRETGNIRVFSKSEAKFGYRESVFKNELKNQYVIADVTFVLTSKKHHINTAYGDIQRILNERQIKNPTIKDVSDAVISIRQSKLPDPKKLGNSGSFFKNPIVDESTFLHFKQKFPEAPFYEVTTTTFKIPAGWLIEKAGFKGKRIGDAGVHKNQALVLVNYGNASGKEILNLSNSIRETVYNLTGIAIEPEVNIF